jgi:hypothetical protein
MLHHLVLQLSIPKIFIVCSLLPTISLKVSSLKVISVCPDGYAVIRLATKWKDVREVTVQATKNITLRNTSHGTEESKFKTKV